MLALVVLSVSLAPFAGRQAPKPSRRGCPQAGIAAHGVAGAVAYACVSTAWYSAGVSLALRGLPPPAARPELASTPPGGLLRLALGRVAKAYALAFAASQLSTPWRAAAAAALVPFVSLFLSRTRRLLGASSLLPAALLALAAAVGLFTAGMAALTAREGALLRSLPASEPQPPEAGGAPRSEQPRPGDLPAAAATR